MLTDEQMPTQATEETVEPKYTMRWLGLQILLILLSAFILSMFAFGIDGMASYRSNMDLLSSEKYGLISSAVSYCFGLIIITLSSITLVELKFRRPVNRLQYGLIAVALWLFNLLLLAMSEHLLFSVSFVIVSVMTIGLVAWFINSITHVRKAVLLVTGILVGEYAILALLIYLGTLALLVGSLLLFGILALSMYFTLKFKVEDEELVMK